MPSFILRNLDPDFWSRVQAKAAREGVTVKALILRLLTQWLALLFLASTTIACGHVNQTKFEPLYRASKAVEASTTTGVSYVQFAPLVQALATELAIARDRVQTDQERLLVEDYAKAAVMYQDSLTVWGAKVRGVPLGTLPALSQDYGFGLTGATYDERLRGIWAQAAVWMSAGHAIYNGTAAGS